MNDPTTPAYRMIKSLPLRFSGSNGLTWFEGETRNVSKSGLYLRAERKEPPGSNVDVEVEFPDGVTLPLTGMVVWSAPPPEDAEVGFGLQLIQPSAEWLARLETMETVATRTSPPPLPGQNPAVHALLDGLDGAKPKKKR